MSYDPNAAGQHLDGCADKGNCHCERLLQERHAAMQPISVRARELACQDARFFGLPMAKLSKRNILQALDAWQARVEERLAAIETLVSGDTLTPEEFEQARARVRQARAESKP